MCSADEALCEEEVYYEDEQDAGCNKNRGSNGEASIVRLANCSYTHCAGYDSCHTEAYSLARIDIEGVFEL